MEPFSFASSEAVDIPVNIRMQVILPTMWKVGKIERNPVFQSRQAMEYFGRTAPGRVGVGGPL